MLPRCSRCGKFDTKELRISIKPIGGGLDQAGWAVCLCADCIAEVVNCATEKATKARQ